MRPEGQVVLLTLFDDKSIPWPESKEKGLFFPLKSPQIVHSEKTRQGKAALYSLQYLTIHFLSHSESQFPLFLFYKRHYSPRTIYNVFWSTDNYSMPDPVPRVDTKIEYWYGEEEKRAREKEHDIEFVSRTYPQTVFIEFKGLA